MKNALHERAVKVSRRYLELEAELVEILIEAESTKLYHDFKCSSLFVYVIGHLGLSRSVAYAFIAVARKAAVVPTLRASIKNQVVTVAAASRLVSQIKDENAEELIEFSTSHTYAETEQMLHARDPERANFKNLKVPAALLEDLKRLRDVLPGKLDTTAALWLAVKESLRKYDPVEKARKARERQTRKSEKASESRDSNIAVKPDITVESLQPAEVPIKNGDHELCAHRVQQAESKSRPRKISIKRKPLKAAEKHEVHRRDGGRCTHRGPDGHRCPNERYLDIHHRIRVADGGSNDPENLQSLCAFHHDLVHQLSFGLEDAVNWI